MFFSKEKVKSIELEKRYKKKSVHTCLDCGAFRNCKSPKMPPTGKNNKNIYFLAECPGGEEDERNTQLVGDSGTLLRDVLEEYDFSLDNDALKDNACRCRMIKDGANRTPTNKEINCCRPNILNTINQIKPKKIILLGKTAVISFLGDRMNDVGGISRWAGFQIPDQFHNCWVFPTFHPSFLLHDPDNIPAQNLFKKHIRTAIEWNEPLPEYKNNLILLENIYDTLTFLRALKVHKKSFVLDYETTGLKPHKNGHKILCMSISNQEFQAYAFPFFDDRRFREQIKSILTDNEIGKVAHNLKFENNWTKHILGYDIEGWIADTMLDAHLIDNRTATTGLKFQTYVNFGFLGYDDDVHGYIEADDGNSFNKLENLPLKKLLTYCAYDSLFTYLLWRKQQRIIKDWPIDRKKLRRLFLDTTKTFCAVEQKGFHIRPEYYQSQYNHLARKIERILNKIQNSEELKGFRKKFNPDSPKQLAEVLFDKLGYTSTTLTETGQPSTDKTVLNELNTEFTNNILIYKKMKKEKDTYLAGFIKEGLGNKLYPINNLNLARSFRSSCRSPNYQNIPIREEEARKLTRSGIIPEPGFQILGCDYSAIEVRMSACNHRDPSMLKYIKDPTTDMHRDMAMEIFLMNDQQMTKAIRHTSKNSFVFPQFYGAYYGSCAHNLWKTVETEKTAEDIPLRIHLADNGITTYEDFENHIREIEDDFWNKRFRVYTKWKKSIWKFYEEHGYITALNGCRFSGLMDFNQVTNFPVQSIACHCLLWSMNQIHKKLEKMDSYILGQIHDEALFCVHPSEVKEVLSIAEKVMCCDIREYYDWIIVPLEIESTITDVDGNWFDKRKIKNEN